MLDCGSDTGEAPTMVGGVIVASGGRAGVSTQAPVWTLLVSPTASSIPPHSPVYLAVLVSFSRGRIVGGWQMQRAWEGLVDWEARGRIVAAAANHRLLTGEQNRRAVVGACAALLASMKKSGRTAVWRSRRSGAGLTAHCPSC